MLPILSFCLAGFLNTVLVEGLVGPGDFFGFQGRVTREQDPFNDLGRLHASSSS